MSWVPINVDILVDEFLSTDDDDNDNDTKMSDAKNTDESKMVDEGKNNKTAVVNPLDELDDLIDDLDRQNNYSSNVRGGVRLRKREEEFPNTPAFRVIKTEIDGIAKNVKVINVAKEDKDKKMHKSESQKNQEIIDDILDNADEMEDEY